MVRDRLCGQQVPEFEMPNNSQSRHLAQWGFAKGASAGQSCDLGVCVTGASLESYPLVFYHQRAKKPEQQSSWPLQPRQGLGCGNPGLTYHRHAVSVPVLGFPGLYSSAPQVSPGCCPVGRCCPFLSLIADF